MTEFANASEIQTQTRRQRSEAKRAVWDGRKGFTEGLDGVADNPYEGWNKLKDGQHSHQCLLWCRWLLGWLIEREKSRS
jgi:hypothetical protein